MSFEPDLFYDFTLMNLGEFLKEKLNEKALIAMDKYADRFPEGYPEVVRGLYYADMPNISVIEYPSLQLYRVSCESHRYKNGNGVRYCQVVIEYSLAYSNLNMLPNILNWVDYHLHRILLDYEYYEFPTGKPVQDDLRFISDRSEYRTGLNILSQEEYPYLRWVIRLRDDACPSPRNREQFEFDNIC